MKVTLSESTSSCECSINQANRAGHKLANKKEFLSESQEREQTRNSSVVGHTERRVYSRAIGWKVD